jgi:hypothetical protein
MNLLATLFTDCQHAKKTCMQKPKRHANKNVAANLKPSLKLGYK